MKKKNNLKTMNKLKATNRIIKIIMLILLFFVLFFSKTSSLLIDNIFNSVNISTGSLSIEVENLKVYEGTSPINYVIPDENHETNITIGPNRINMFSFEVRNTGLAGVTADVYLNINFNDNLQEEGVLIVFPANMSDADIMNALKNGDDSAAIIEVQSDGQTLINSSEGTFAGIRKKIDSKVFDSALPNGTTGIIAANGETMCYYEYKIVFFNEIVRDINCYDKTIEVKIEAIAKIYDSAESNWDARSSDYFKIATIPDLKYNLDGLILLYEAQNNTGQGFNSSATVWKDLIGANDGILMGGPTWDYDYLEFDGVDDKVKFTGNIPNRYTIISTFYNDPNSTANWQRICGETPFPGLYIDREKSPRILGIFAHGVDKRFPNSEFSGIVQTAMTYDGQNVSLYINGVFVGSVATTTNPTSTAEAFLGGRAANDRQLTGRIYNFMIYDKVLTATEISESYEDYEFKIKEVVIPIRTVDQLIKIGSNEILKIDGQYYHMTDNSTYELKNDLSFEYEGIWNPILNSEGRLNTYGKIITIEDTLNNEIYYHQNQVYVTADNAIKNGLVLHYDAMNNTGTGYDENSLIWKDLVGSNDGILNGATWINNGLTFDGVDDKVAFIGNITSNYTMVVTMKPKLVGDYPRLFAERPFPTLYLHSTTNYRPGFYGMTVDKVFPSTVAPSTTVPTYVVMTYDGNEITLYVDGIKTSSLANATLPVSTAIAYLGGNGGLTRQYTGVIYDFMVYDRVLTDFEIERSNLTNKAKYMD